MSELLWTTLKNCWSWRPNLAFLHDSEKLSSVQDVFRATDEALDTLLNRTGCYISFGMQLNLTSLTGLVRNGFPLPKHSEYTVYMAEWQWAYISNANKVLFRSSLLLTLQLFLLCSSWVYVSVAVLKQNMEIKHTGMFLNELTVQNPADWANWELHAH